MMRLNILQCKDVSMYISQLMWYITLNRMKNKNQMITSIDAEKAFNKKITSFHDKKRSINWNKLQLNKGHIQQIQSQHHPQQ